MQRTEPEPGPGQPGPRRRKPDKLERTVFGPFAGVLDGDTQLLAVLGNHDVDSGYGVDLVFSGHDHDDQRTEPIEGVTSIVSGAAAKTRPTTTADFAAAASSTFHFVDVAIWPDRVELRAVNHDGGVFDSLTLDTTP